VDKLIVRTESGNIDGIFIGCSLWGLICDLDGGGSGDGGNGGAYRLKDEI